MGTAPTEIMSLILSLNCHRLVILYKKSVSCDALPLCQLWPVLLLHMPNSGNRLQQPTYAVTPTILGKARYNHLAAVTRDQAG
jgi:hypothetical protein